MYNPLVFRGHGAAEDHLDQDKDDAATVKRGDREEVNDTKVDADHGNEKQKLQMKDQ